MTYISTEELESDFYSEHCDEIEKYEDAFLTPHVEACRENDYKKKLALFDKAIENYYTAEKWFISHGAGGGLYLMENWLHCHNSKNPDFKWIDHMKANRENALDGAMVQDYILEHASEGIVQKDIVKLFPEIEAGTIRSVVYQLHKAGKIRKEKHGNTNLITLP